MSLNPSARLPGFAATLLIGLGVGWLAANHRPSVARGWSGGADRIGDYAVTTAPVIMDYNERTKIQAAEDAVFFLDYRAARLVVTIPSYRQSNKGTQVLDNFVERDLAADFKLNDASPKPHFVMTAGSLGARGSGWSPLFVFETVSRQVAVYRVQPLSVGTRSQTKFELLEVKSFAPALPTPAPSEAGLGGPGPEEPR